MVIKTKPKSKLTAKKSGLKKLTPASLTAQKAWAGFSPKLKKELRKTLPDTDRDGTPNGFDCRPRNKKRQESFSPDDEAYLNKTSMVQLGDYIGGGQQGDVFSVVGSKNLVVKAPKYFGDTPEAPWDTQPFDNMDLEEESQVYRAYNLNKEPLFIPTKLMQVKSNNPANTRSCVGMVRPRVSPIVNKMRRVSSGNLRRLTDSQIMEIRRKVIALTEKGYTLWDGLQVGFDAQGRVLLYDAGRVTKAKPSDSEALNINDCAWMEFLGNIGRYDDYEKFGGALKIKRKPPRSGK